MKDDYVQIQRVREDEWGVEWSKCNYESEPEIDLVEIDSVIQFKESNKQTHHM